MSCGRSLFYQGTSVSLTNKTILYINVSKYTNAKYMKDMTNIYPIYFVNEIIFVWMQILYIICGNNNLVTYYNTESYTPLHTVPYNTEYYTPLQTMPYNTEFYTPLHTVPCNTESYIPLHTVPCNTESYTPLHTVPYKTESYTSLHTVP